MRGHIVKRGKDSYSVVINLGKDPATGRRKQQWLTVKGTKKDAERQLAETLHQMDTGAYVKPGKITFGSYLETWLAEYAKPNLSPHSYERYAGIVRGHLVPELGNIPLTQLRASHIQKHYTAKLDGGLSPKTVYYHHAIIHKALKVALKRGLVARNVADSADAPKAKRPDMKTWDENEAARFLEAAQSSPYYPLFHLALYTGARRSELLALRWQDVDLIMGQIYINRGLHQLEDNSYIFSQPKSARSRRTVALPPSAILTLTRHYEKQAMDRALLGTKLTDGDLVFSRYDGAPLRPDTITNAWKTLAKRAGVQTIRFHDARHTHASLMLKQGVHPKIVQERLGHASISMTLDTYSHVAPGLQQAAAVTFDKLITTKVPAKTAR